MSQPISPPIAATSHIYTPKQLQHDARQLCKGLGRFITWEIEALESGDVRLVAKFTRRYNPLRPTAQQAIERVTMVL